MRSTAWTQNILVFDLETKRAFDDVAGRNPTRQLGMSLGVVYNYRTDTYTTYREEQARELIDTLLGADLVIGFNCVRFDYEVLYGYTEGREPLAHVKTRDMLLDLEKLLGHRVSLNALAGPTLKEHKSGHGLQAIDWFRQGNWRDLEHYCRDDVRITKDLYDFGAQHGYLLYENRRDANGTGRVEVSWPRLTEPENTARMQGRLF
jgi:DEAD/DEAH box helicase domain-containing protein